MARRNAGFTLVEVVAVVAVVASSAAIVVPKALYSQVRANERAAVATLRAIADAQSACQASGAIDVNGNSIGEHAFFSELAGTVNVRSALHPIYPPLLSSAFGVVALSTVHRGGYQFRMFLPGFGGYGYTEAPLGGDPGNTLGIDPQGAESLWCCYAWPQAYGTTGRRTFFINQDGDVLSTHAHVLQYSGWSLVPYPSAAFASGTSGTMYCPPAAQGIGDEGNMWHLVH